MTVTILEFIIPKNDPSSRPLSLYIQSRTREKEKIQSYTHEREQTLSI